MLDAGIVVICALISPFKAERAAARALFDEGDFIEVFVSTPKSIAEQRDPKGLYKKAREGNIQNFTSISSRYETPENPDLEISTEKEGLEGAVYKIIRKLQLE
jgi:adenylylsulfate kinase-like enzyme